MRSLGVRVPTETGGHEGRCKWVQFPSVLTNRKGLEMERDCFYNELKYVRDYACKAAGLDSEIAGWKTAVDAMTKQLADAQATVEALQAELTQRTGWQQCATHGQINADHAWGCPECVRSLRGQVEALQRERDEQIRERERYFQLWMQATEERNEMRKERDEAQWPNVLAPAMYDNPDPGWKDTQVPDLTRIWGLAREVGYAVGLHGSLKRDMDLIAVPWAEEAVGNAELIDHLCKGLPAVRIGGPEHKPHKRVAVTLQMDGYFKPIDLSIVYRTTTLQAAMTPARGQELEDK